MKLSYFWILLLFLSCSSKDCFEFDGLTWCMENVDRSKITEKFLIVSNNTDGLNFEARITSNCSSEFKDNITYPDTFTVQKNDLTFEVFYVEEMYSLTYSDLRILKGLAVGGNDKNQLCVEWQGANKKKAMRLIKQLLGS